MRPGLPVALTIAGSDPSGGAGIQADLKTFHQFGVYGEAVIAVLTVQNTLTVSRVEIVAEDIVTEQIEAVISDMPPGAAKTGALGSASVVRAVARLARRFAFPLVVDPVMISKHGAPLIAGDGRDAFVEHLLPRAFLIAPNVPEAEALAGMEIRGLDDMRRAAERLLALGARNALIKGGHREGDAVDFLLTPGGAREFRGPRIATRNTHGTGCTFSAAIAAGLAKGSTLEDAVASAKAFVTEAIRTNPGLGHGRGPVNHHARCI